MWHDMMTSGISLTEKALRTILVYLALVVLLRLVGKRGLAQLNEFDLVVMLLLSNVVQNAIIGPDNSLIGGLFGAAVLMAANAFLVRYATKYAWISWLFEGRPSVLARSGRYDEHELRRQGLRRADVDQAIHQQGGDSVTETDIVVLTPGGALLVRLNDMDHAADKADVKYLVQALRRIEQRLG
ncbi:YetF domain-containing protein [Streptomyces sp. NPDC048659]|uniref:DUF421 domain-containing protein n=1 Tax=Streptomyces sp. NPDC048659 TaxID=3155489 RepID=UPI0034420001